MTDNAPLKNMPLDISRPHDTIRKLRDRRMDRPKRRTTEDKLRILCNLQAMLLELKTEKATHGHA
jgi:hypothetical protein